MQKQKFEVYGFIVNGNQTLFSKGVTRDFGENKVVFTESNEFLSSVLPLQDSGGLEFVGHIYNTPTKEV
jgi:hypothetical protein